MSAHVVRKLARGEALSASDDRHVAACAKCSSAVADARALDERLAAAARSLAASPLPDGMLHQPLQRRPSLFAWTPVVALVLIVAVAVGLGISSGLSRVVPGPSSSPAEPSLRIGTDEAEEFISVTDSDLNGGSLLSVAAGDGVVVAGGQVCATDFTCKSAIWRSPEGSAWSSPQFLRGAGENGVSFVGYAGDQWLALADGIWYSPDGVVWHAANGDFADGQADGGPSYTAEGGCCSAEVLGATHTRSGFVAVGGVGCFKCRGRAAVWRSSDGRSWARVPYQQSFDGSPMRSVFLLREGRLVAIGGEQVWVSDDDGRSWTVRTLPASEGGLSALLTQDGSLRGISTDALGASGASWISVDGTSWARTPLPALYHGLVLAMVEVDGATYVSASYPSSGSQQNVLFRLTESNEVKRVSVEADTQAYIAAMTTTGGRVVAVGHIANPERGAVWLGR